MSLGIENIAHYIPEAFLSNYDRKSDFGIEDSFIIEKLGIETVSRKGADEEASDLCCKAYENLIKKQDINVEEIECLFVVTQNPDYNIPHTSAIVHGKLNFPESCACMDISLGCSGYVYSLSVITSFMKSNGMKKGLLFTADPYSKIIDPTDKNTVMLFGDAASVSLISDTPVYEAGLYNFGTIGNKHRNLICEEGELFMNGRAIFNFAAKYVPSDIMCILEKNGCSKEDIDLFLFHQGSKIIVNRITKQLELPIEKVPFTIGKFGNTVSSSIPILLEEFLYAEHKKLVISGFGVGLSWASTVLTRR